ncbi:hypothetical protein N0V86_006467 [Didymella sp. IMI 355093]|nr:hypothetical protein N0V86_006467 [Didymella sp. IMI 355093]
MERVLRMGHAYGEVIIEFPDVDSKAEKERMIMPFKIETSTRRRKTLAVLAIVPDLVWILDAQNGEALGTQEYRYGLPVIVLGIMASEKWTSIFRGLEIGRPKGFGFSDLEYKPLGKFSEPRSVIDEFDTPL